MEIKMAKNKQKTSTQPQTTKKLDLCDQRKVERFVSSEFDVSRQYLKKIRVVVHGRYENNAQLIS